MQISDATEPSSAFSELSVAVCTDSNAENSASAGGIEFKRVVTDDRSNTKKSQRFLILKQDREDEPSKILRGVGGVSRRDAKNDLIQSRT